MNLSVVQDCAFPVAYSLSAIEKQENLDQLVCSFMSDHDKMIWSTMEFMRQSTSVSPQKFF